MGDYFYFLRTRDFPSTPATSSGPAQYEVYVRQKASLVKTNQVEAEKQEEVVLDLAELTFIPKQLLRKTLVQKFKISDDQTTVAFILDVGNTEKLVGGFKNIQTGKILPVQIDNVSDIIFGEEHTVYYSEVNDQNRPYKVVRMDLDSGESECIFVDDEPTHYVDIGSTKDKRFIVIASNTKEDSEIWVLDRQKDRNSVLPKKLFAR